MGWPESLKIGRVPILPILYPQLQGIWIPIKNKKVMLRYTSIRPHQRGGKYFPPLYFPLHKRKKRVFFMSPLAVFEKSSENLHFYFLKWWKFYAKKLRFFVFLFTCKKQKKWPYWWDSLQCGQMEVYFKKCSSIKFIKKIIIVLDKRVL